VCVFLFLGKGGGGAKAFSLSRSFKRTHKPRTKPNTHNNNNKKHTPHTKQLALIPNADAVGCFAPGWHASMLQAAGWELLMTATLVLVVYAVAVGEPSFGNVAPLAVGLTLFATAISAGRFSGASLNPARTFGPALVFRCWGAFLPYTAAQLLGGLIAALVSAPLYGFGVDFGRLTDSAGAALDGARDALRAGYARVTQGAQA
jgi:hypothetical protein